MKLTCQNMKDDCDFAVFKYRTIKNVLLDNNRKLKHEMPFIKQSAMSERVNMNSRVAYEAPKITSHKRRYFLMCKKSFLTFAICRRLDAWCVTKSRGKRPSNWAVPWSLPLSLSVCVWILNSFHWMSIINYTGSFQYIIQRKCVVFQNYFLLRIKISHSLALPFRYVTFPWNMTHC